MKKQVKKTAIKEGGSDNYTVILLEEMKGQFKAFGEGLGALSEQFEEFKDTQEVLVKKVDKLEIGQKVLFDKVGKVESRLDKVEIKLDVVSKDVVEIKHKLSQKVDLEDFQKLEKRVIGLEKLILSRAN